MLDDRALTAAASAAGLSPLRFERQLGGSDRSQVCRVADADGTTYVVKQYLSRDGGTYAREPAALEALAGTGVGPRLLGSSHDPDLVVLADLGTHPTVADALLGRDPDAASAAIDGWVDAIAALHLAGDDDVLDTYGRRLSARAKDMDTHRMPGTFSYAADRYEGVGQRLGVAAPPGFLEALRDLTAGLGPAPPVLTPGDACPDNNLLSDGRVVLLDHEFAEVRHPIWDVAYLRVPWPTCWCSWRLPDAVADGAVDRYRAAVAPRVPSVTGDRFLADLDLATLGWCLSSCSWQIETAIEEDRGPDGLDGPTARPKILHRLWLASRLPGPAPLTAYARRLLDELSRLWGEPTLVLAPAFRSDDITIP
ncbi:hypothetical protein [Nocardioides bigeumensis]|uniref:Aminoglycoside phosphotransferase family protein n=1 Tax=Nocardioides bigeumensis TaxID=433657 RepID=A0ABP5JI96_9ACTN